jgi:hypothetical protein
LHKVYSGSAISQLIRLINNSGFAFSLKNVWHTTQTSASHQEEAV